MANDDSSLVDDFNQLKADDPSAQTDGFYADDVQAAALADNQMEADLLVEDDDVPVTSGEMVIGDLDAESDEVSEDEEAVPGSDNVIG